ncbi:metallophosphoesterase [Pontiella sp.]|uniref:metallophosphoesterase family protein n=1 Tax=Pontiella sp. TaxID=2837462 RepID=UPI003567F448
MVGASTVNVGLLTDLHYDGSAAALNRLYGAVATLNAGGAKTLVVMGDLVNGNSEHHAKRLLREVSALCDAFKGTTYFMHGNHDLDHLTKAEFYNTLGCAGNASRFDFEAGGYRFICIDCNFTPEGEAYGIGNFEWERCAVPAEELDWLRGRMAASLNPVIILSHQRIDQPSRFSVQNVDEVRKTLSLAEKVTAVVQGHNHVDDLVRLDQTSYYTLSAHVDDAGPAMLELTPKGVRLIRDFQPPEKE